MKRVIITLEFEDDDVDDAEVINCLNELIDQNCLNYEIEEKGKANETLSK
mgnify:FL=1